MKKKRHSYLMRFIIAFVGLIICCSSLQAQVIPADSSSDYIIIPNQWEDTVAVFYYKPSNYNSASPILMYMHGAMQNGDDAYALFKDVADRRNALVVAPTIRIPVSDGHIGWDTLQSSTGEDSIVINWSPLFIKEIYQHVLQRENKDSMWVYLTGWSNGGQIVTRYMLLRQVFPDLVPIRMALSVSPLYYTFPADSLNGVCMPWPCGLGEPYSYNDWRPKQLQYANFICNEHIVKYYNENYAVMVGTADILEGSGWVGGCQCLDAEGGTRYDNAKNFYAFSDTDAVNRGTALTWQYREIPGIGHSKDPMYGAKDTLTDTSTIAEKLLFESPYYAPVNLAPSGEFTVEASNFTCNEVSVKAHCIYNEPPLTVQWDFGDSTGSNAYEVTHTYNDTGTYTITLSISNSLGGDITTQNVTINDLPPVADFAADTTMVYLPNATVQFNNNSIDAAYYYWDFGDSSFINTDVNPQHTYLWADTFTVSLTAVNGSNGCINVLEKGKYIIVSSSSGVGGLSIGKLRVNVYPNPNTGRFTLEMNLQKETELSINLYHFTGQLIRSEEIGNISGSYTQQIDLNGYSKGVYFVQISTDNSVLTRKVVLY